MHKTRPVITLLHTFFQLSSNFSKTSDNFPVSERDLLIGYLKTKIPDRQRRSSGLESRLL